MNLMLAERLILINTLENYFYDDDIIYYDEEKLEDLCKTHNILKR